MSRPLFVASVVIAIAAMMPPAVAESEIVAVRRADIAYSALTGGQVVPLRANDLYFAPTVAFSGGRVVKKVHVDEGSTVEEGDVLVELDSTDADERVSSAQSALSAARQAAAAAAEAARRQAEQAARLMESAAAAAADAAASRESASAQAEACAALVAALARTAVMETEAVLSNPPPGLPADPTYEQLLPYLPQTRAGIASLGSCQGQLASTSSSAGAKAATAALLEQQASAMQGAGQSQASAAQARVAAAQRQLEQAERARRALTLHAPYSGVITAVRATKGSTFSSSTAPVSIRSSELVARAELVEADLLAVKEGAAASVKVASAGVDMSTTVGTLPTDPLQGVVGPSRYPLYFPLEKNGKLRPGQSARIRITVEAKEGALVVPTTAVGGRGTDTYVTVVTGRGEERRRVVAGMISDSYTEIVDGLSEGEVVKRRPARQV